jgi:hypothetical protein
MRDVCLVSDVCIVFTSIAHSQRANQRGCKHVGWFVNIVSVFPLLDPRTSDRLSQHEAVICTTYLQCSDFIIEE